MSGSEPGRREVAYRLFAAEFEDAEFSYSESDEERAPNYVVSPTGARVNRLFAVGVLTEVESVNPEMVRGRVVDPTGAFVTYAGQYQPEALAFLERADPPSFISLSGKARTFQPEDGDQVFSSVRPESASEVDAETRDRWVVTTAERTIERIGIMASAIEADLVGDQLRSALVDAGVDERLADGVALALEYYDTTPAYLEALHETALNAVRVVAGEREEVGRFDAAPDEGMGDASALATLDLPSAPTPETAASAAGVGDEDDEEKPAASAEPSEPAEPSETTTESDTEAAEPTTTAGTDVSEPPTEEPTEQTTETESVDSEPTAEEPVAAEPDIGEEDEPTESEPVAETEPETGSESAAVGTEEPADVGTAEGVEEELEDFDPGEFELDEEERREVEEEFGTEFSTADEVEPADIETPAEQPEDPAETGVEEPESAEETETGSESDPEETVSGQSEAESGAEQSEAAPESEPEPSEPEAETSDPAAGDTDAEELDVGDAVMETMERLDEGDGADREALVEHVVESHGVPADDVEEAIQDALMSGRCYEPSDGTLKSI